MGEINIKVFQNDPSLMAFIIGVTLLVTGTVFASHFSTTDLPYEPPLNLDVIQEQNQDEVDFIAEITQEQINMAIEAMVEQAAQAYPINEVIDSETYNYERPIVHTNRNFVFYEKERGVDTAFLYLDAPRRRGHPRYDMSKVEIFHSIKDIADQRFYATHGWWRNTVSKHCYDEMRYG